MRPIHELKTLSKFFRAACSGEKTFELRKFDRDFSVGDSIILQEGNMIGDEFVYTGRQLDMEIVYLLNGGEFGIDGIDEGYCILGVQQVPRYGPYINEALK